MNPLPNSWSFSRSLFVLSFLLFSGFVSAQNSPETERVRLVEERLRALSVTVPGLNQPVQLAVSGVSAQEFLRALAQSNQLNINIDPQLDFKIYNNFTKETALNVLLFLSKQYNLDINLTGSIMSIARVAQAPVIVPVKDIVARYNSQNNTLSLELANDSLIQVAKKITQLSQKNVVVPANLAGKRVTGFYSEAPFETALEKLAYTNDLKLVKTNDNIFLFQALAENEELFVTPEKRTDVRRNFKPAQSTGNGNTSPGNFNLYSSGQGSSKRISVDASNTPIADVVKTVSQEAGINYFNYSEIKGNISMHVKDIPFNDFLGALFQGTDYTYKVDNGIYLLGDRKNEGLRTNRVIQLQYRSIDTIQNMIPQEWRRGVEIKEFKEQNTILLSGSAPQIAEIEGYIKQLDRLVPMVLIEVTLVDVRKGKTVSSGISAGLDSTSRKTGGTLLGPGIDMQFGAKSINELLSKLGSNSAINLGRVTPNFYVKLSALEKNENVEIRSVPKLSTLNGHNATLSIGSKRYYSTQTQNIVPSLNAQTLITQQFTGVEANLSIGIRPIVSGDDQVTLNIKVEISDFIGTPPPNAPPPTSTSKFESIIRAHNEDMIVLGGLERTESSENGNGVPLLSRIPVIKWLFSSRSKTNNKVVTLVFIKPTIMY